MSRFRFIMLNRALHWLAGDVIDRGVREHPELGIGVATEGIEVRSVGNTPTLHESALVEAFNLKAAIRFENDDGEWAGGRRESVVQFSRCVTADGAREALTDMPPRWEEELDSVTLHNQALCSMDVSPSQAFHKLQFLMQRPGCPRQTLRNLLISYCRHGYYDLASGVVSGRPPAGHDAQLSSVIRDAEVAGTVDTTSFRPFQYVREFVDAVIVQQTSPDEAYRRLDDMANKLSDGLRKAARAVQECRDARDDRRAKSALLDYEKALERLEGRGTKKRKNERLTIFRTRFARFTPDSYRS